MSNTTATVTVTWGSGRNTLYAGTPLDSSGNIANNSSAYGILAQDIHMPDRSATVITAGEWTENPACGILLSDECKAKLGAIAFSPPLVEYVTEDEMEDYVPQTQTATTEMAGLVKMAEAVPDTEEQDAPTASEFNALLASLRAAGILETPEAEENTSTK